MSYSHKVFTQSLRFIDPINQERIKQQSRILWPDYEALTLINSFEEAAQKQDTLLDLSTLFMYCSFEEKFLVKKTTKKEYLNLNECYDPEFTHVAVYMIKKHNYGQENTKLISENSRSVNNRRKNSLQKMYRPTKIGDESRELYLILSRRSIAIDEVIKTSHKVCFSVVPLSGMKYLWGGTLNYEEFEPSGQDQGNSNQQENSLFKSGGQNFGFNITSKPSNLSGSIRKTNGTIDKRQLRFSNYYSSKKSTEQDQTLQTNTKEPKQYSNTIKLTPQHIRQHQEFLYIEVDLNNTSLYSSNPSDYNFVSIDIFGRHMKPKYGGKYEDQSSEQSEDDELNNNLNSAKKFRKFMKEEIFLIYSMPFMMFNSYLESQLNFQENMDIREINFRGSCSMFSAMKKLELRSGKKQEEGQSKGQKDKKEEKKQQIKEKSLEIGKKKKFNCSFDSRIDQNSQENSVQSKRVFFQISGKEELSKKNNKNSEGFEMIQVVEQSEQQKDWGFNLKKKMSMKNIKQKLIRSLCIKVIQNRTQSNNVCELIYFPIFNPTGSEANRMSISSNLLFLINNSIQKETTKVEIESHRLKNISDKQQIQIDAPKQHLTRQSMYIGKSHKKQSQTNNQNIHYTNINVFLTDKVYKQEAVEVMVDFLERVQKIVELGKEFIENNHEWISEFDNFVRRIFSVQQIKNVFSLLDDLSSSNQRKHQQIGKIIKLLIWIEMFTAMDHLTSSQLDLIFFVKKQTETLILGTKHTQTYPSTTKKQQTIIQLIKDYHEKSTFDQSLKKFLIELFFYFFYEQLSNNGYFFETFELVSAKKEEFESEMSVIEDILGKFFMMNCHLVLGTYSSQLELLFQKMQGQSREEEENEKDVEIDRDQLETVTVLEKDQNKNAYCLVKLLKTSVIYTIENISDIPINIFLSQPLEPFQNNSQDQSQNPQPEETRTQTPASCKKLKKFLLRYFIRGHNYYLQRQTNQGLYDLDTNVGYMNLIADMLGMYIKVGNIELDLIEGNKGEKVRNVIQLVNHQYRKCLRLCSIMRLRKLNSGIQNIPVASEQVANFQIIKPNQKDHHEKIVLSRFQNIPNSNQYTSFKTSFHINIPKSKSASIQLQNTKQSFPLSTNKSSQEKFDFLLTMTKKDLLEVDVLIKPNQRRSGHENDSYEISFLNTQLGLKSDSNMKMSKTLFSCFEVLMEVEIFVGRSQKISKEKKEEVERITFYGSKILIFDNFNTSSISNNTINLSNFDKQPSLRKIAICSIHEVTLRLHSRKLSILQDCLSFINLRLNKYLKTLLSPLSIKPKCSSRKTIGGRFTEHLSKRNDMSLIEEDMDLGRKRYNRGRNMIETKKTTLYDLPEEVLYHLLSADKCYVQEEQKMLKFVDEYYERNQPIYHDYILYLAIRPQFIRLSTVIKHFFANRIKYQDSVIVKSFLRIKIPSEQVQLTNIFTTMPRISSLKPFKNVKDTLQERDLLVKYVKESSKRHSLEKGMSKGLSGIKNNIEEIKEVKRESDKDVEI